MSTRPVRHPIFARLYARVSPGVERKGAAEHRDELLAGVAGRVIEIGAGNGLNFAHYPASVTEVVAVEPEPYLRGRAQEAAESAPVPVTIVDGVADDLPADDGAFDAAVASLVLCSVPDQATALAEVRRVLRPGVPFARLPVRVARADSASRGRGTGLRALSAGVRPARV